ncbi:hypothetical protein Rumeso_02230 [Rubellimicrobium mesophilum DSM 19309]|uniref:DUF3592 domain-containing protein n=1 Tax=Rubellimicrobium mesophilum DSM 19309 TaxID=442562 RepID=A0A017HPC2_9RHOB|nr:DUF3592 domain-containing protein [Rubellimicrobium mesophilum]EYD76155.1 hypothetical protein Rumeso_02230 [Rubellimicrobium mesophilum DSM 19309]
MFIELFKRGGFVTLICGLMALGFACLAQDARTTAQALADHGQTAIATVMDKERETTRRSSGSGSRHQTQTSYTVTYLFEVDSEIQRVEVGVPEEVYDAVRVGEQAEIRYLPEEPTAVEVFPGQMASGGTAMAVVAGVLALAAVLAAGIAVILTKRARLGAQPA